MRPVTLVVPIDPAFLQRALEWLCACGDEAGLVYRGEVDEPIDRPLEAALIALFEKRLRHEKVRLGKRNLTPDIDNALHDIAKYLAPYDLSLIEAKHQVLYVPMGKLFLVFG